MGGDVISTGRRGKELGNPRGELKSKLSSLRDSQRVRNKKALVAEGTVAGATQEPSHLTAFSPHSNITTVRALLYPFYRWGN